MPFDKEIATGESLIALQKSAALREFEGVIAVRENEVPSDPPPIVKVERTDWIPSRVVAIDGSSITHKVRNGFPGAEASLVMLSVVFIDVSKLSKISPHEIPSPRIFNEMDRASTLDAVLPGSNIVRSGDTSDTPVRFFRKTVFETIAGVLDTTHESLLETLRTITANRVADIKCPIEECNKRYKTGINQYSCECARHETFFETDAFRFHERFNELGSNGEVHGEVRHVLEVLSLVNILRFFESDARIHYLKDCAFVLDGPLAVFGQPAWIAPYVKGEIQRISAKARRHNNRDLLLMGIEKSGQYVSHFADIDWTDDKGPRSKFNPTTVLIPDARYVNRNIVFRPENSKPSGVDTYFGRKVFYKTKSSAHAVLNLAIVNEQGDDFHNTNAEAFPRLGDGLNILDHLSTYLYEDGFMPLVRAHAHAAFLLSEARKSLQVYFRGNSTMSGRDDIDAGWTPSSAEGRWCGFGPYYAMFPVTFARQAIERFCPPRGRVLDPFCGRGTAPFVALVTGRHALGADVNPVAWLFSSVKLDPCPTAGAVLRRVENVLDCVTNRDRTPRNEFQKWAWHPDVLGFLHSARRSLSWKSDRIDRMLMGTILVHLHAKRGEGLSNQLRQSKSMSPNYSVKWWKHNQLKAPRIEIKPFFEKKLSWRYRRGIPLKEGAAEARLGDARRVLSQLQRFEADFVLTSPPYCGVTNYRYDNWIRLWMLGGPNLPDFSSAHRFENREDYRRLLEGVFVQVKRHAKRNASIYVRTDARHFTLGTTVEVLGDLWPRHRLSSKFDRAPGMT